MSDARKRVGARTALTLVAAAQVFMGHAAVRGSSHPEDIGPLGSLIRTNYHGWTNSLLLSNGRVEAVIVPAVGRVMQFRFVGQEDGPFWENRAMDGLKPEPGSTEWGNFGGDKSWPAPQADWNRVTPRAWPPPVAFDAMPVEVKADGFVVTLVSAVDPDYGIRTVRRIRLDLDRPVMTIDTTYEKVAGAPLRVSVWVITQLKDPVLACAQLPKFGRFREGYSSQSEELPARLKIADGLLSLTRDPKASHKVGTDSGILFWVGRDSALVIVSARQIFGDYPDDGCSAEIYTNPDPLGYVELEMLGPLQKMIVGDKISRSSTYTLLRRTEVDPDLEVRKLLSR